MGLKVAKSHIGHGMEVRSVYIEKIENKGRALWVLGVFAHDWEGTMPAHARAVAGGGGWPAPGRALARVWVRVPYPACFFLNQVSRVWVTRSIPAPLAPPGAL